MLWISFARGSAISGFVVELWYMSCRLSIRLFSFVKMVVSFGLCKIVRVSFDALRGVV